MFKFNKFMLIHKLGNYKYSLHIKPFSDLQKFTQNEHFKNLLQNCSPIINNLSIWHLKIRQNM